MSTNTRDEHLHAAGPTSAKLRVFYPNPEIDGLLLKQAREAVRQSRALLEQTDSIIRSQPMSEFVRN